MFKEDCYSLAILLNLSLSESQALLSAEEMTGHMTCELHDTALLYTFIYHHQVFFIKREVEREAAFIADVTAIYLILYGSFH